MKFVRIRLIRNVQLRTSARWRHSAAAGSLAYLTRELIYKLLLRGLYIVLEPGHGACFCIAGGQVGSGRRGLLPVCAERIVSVISIVLW